MSAACLSSKYGYCKFRNNCSKAHFTDICEVSECSGYKCDKRHPKDCFFFKNYGRCKFGSYCSYKHALSREMKLEEDVNALKLEMKTLKTELETVKEEVKALKRNQNDKKCMETINIPNKKVEKETVKEKESKNNKEQTSVEVERNISKSKVANEKEEENKNEGETLEEIMREQSLEELIRENSGLYCDLCQWGPAKTKKGLITHKRKKHSNISTKIRN